MRAHFVGFTHDRLYVTFGDVATEAEVFTCRRDAEHKLRERIASNSPVEVAYPVCHDDLVATHLWEEHSGLLPPMSEDAFIDLYRLSPTEITGWATVASDPEFRLSVGPRGGVRVEKF